LVFFLFLYSMFALLLPPSLLHFHPPSPVRLEDMGFITYYVL
jgi:hypothetical protein